MSIADDIRAALRTGLGPMTAAEVREACGEDYSAEQIGGALYSMHQAGELVRDGEGRGKFTYLLDSSYEPKQPRSAPPPAASPKKPQRAAEAKTVARPITMRASPVEHVELPRADLRAIVIALISRHPDPMPDELRGAVVGAITATM